MSESNLNHWILNGWHGMNSLIKKKRENIKLVKRNKTALHNNEKYGL